MSTAPRILLTATCAGLSGLIGVPPAGAELTDPAPTARADLYFEPGEMVADPQRDVVYLLDNTNSRVVAYDTEAARITVAAALDGDPENGIPVVTRDGGELWVPLPASQRIQKFSLPELRSIDVFHVGSAFYSLAEGADGNIYALNTNGLSRIDGTSGMTLSTTSADFDYYPLLKGAYGGQRLFLIDRGLSGGSDPTRSSE